MGMRIGGYFWCFALRHHEWRTSRKKPGHDTCVRCRMRRKTPAEALASEPIRI